MIFLIEALSLVVPLLITLILYYIYYQIFIIGYLRRIKKAINNKEFDKAAIMKKVALKKQHVRMDMLFRKHGI